MSAPTIPIAAQGAVQDPEKGTIIPSSRRPDGTWRKERKVREGNLSNVHGFMFQGMFHKMKCQNMNQQGRNLHER